MDWFLYDRDLRHEKVKKYELQSLFSLKAEAYLISRQISMIEFFMNVVKVFSSLTIFARSPVVDV